METENKSYVFKLLDGTHSFRANGTKKLITVKRGGFVRSFERLDKVHKNKFKLIQSAESEELEGQTIVDIPRPVAPVAPKYKVDITEEAEAKPEAKSPNEWVVKKVGKKFRIRDKVTGDIILDNIDDQDDANQRVEDHNMSIQGAEASA